MVQLPGAAPQKVDVAGRTFDSSRIGGLEPEQLAFQLQAERLCFVKSWIVLTVTRGSASSASWSGRPASTAAIAVS